MQRIIDGDTAEPAVATDSLVTPEAVVFHVAVPVPKAVMVPPKAVMVSEAVATLEAAITPETAGNGSLRLGTPTHAGTTAADDTIPADDAPMSLDDTWESLSTPVKTPKAGKKAEGDTIVVSRRQQIATQSSSQLDLSPQKTTPRKTNLYKPIHDNYPTVLFQDGDWYSVSCHFCGANASDKDTLFEGLIGLANHYRKVHQYSEAQIRELPRVDKQKKINKETVKTIKEGCVPKDFHIEVQPEVGVDGKAEIGELGEAIHPHYQGVRKHGQHWYEVICAECGCNANTTTFEYLTPEGVREHFRHIHNANSKVAFYRLRRVSDRDAAAMQVGEWPIDTPMGPKIGLHLRGSNSRPFNGQSDVDGEGIFAQSPSRKQIKRPAESGIASQVRDSPSKKRRETDQRTHGSETNYQFRGAAVAAVKP